MAEIHLMLLHEYHLSIFMGIKSQHAVQLVRCTLGIHIFRVAGLMSL